MSPSSESRNPARRRDDALPQRNSSLCCRCRVALRKIPFPLRFQKSRFRNPERRVTAGSVRSPVGLDVAGLLAGSRLIGTGERSPGAAIAKAWGLPKPLASVPLYREREEDEDGPL